MPLIHLNVGIAPAIIEIFQVSYILMDGLIQSECTYEVIDSLMKEYFIMETIERYYIIDKRSIEL